MLLLLMMSTFMLGLMAFAVDLTGMWFHRQSAQSAADAACLAGASDMLAIRAGVTPPAGSFTPGTNGNCASTPNAALCKYASFNGYSGAGLSNSSPSNSVTWNFPSTVSGATSSGSFPFLQVAITENVRAYFIGLLKGSQFQPISAASTCGVTLVATAPPVVVLSPNASGAFTYSGGAALNIVGGPARGLEVNSSSSTAVSWAASGILNMSRGGPNQTGSDVAVFGGPKTAPTNGSSNGYSGGTTGHWSGGALPLQDPFSSVGPPYSIKSLTPKLGTSGGWKDYLEDGCPDTRRTQTGVTGQACKEFSPGYYPSGLDLTDPKVMNNYSTAIFAPGIYYLNGSLTIGGSASMRMAKPTGFQATDGVMFYFYSGSLNISGCSGCQTNGVNNESSSDLSCNGTAPISSLGMPSSIYGNILWAQCTKNGTYWDAGGDTSDSRGNVGSRGLLIFHDHGNTTAPVFSGSGALSFSGSIYLHSNSYASTLNLSGGSSSGTFIIGDIIADKINLSGSGMINLALNPAKTIEISKVALLN